MDQGYVDKKKKPRFDVTQTNIKKVKTKQYPPTQAQLDLIHRLNSQLTEAGVRTSYIKAPEDKKTAELVISSLIELARKHGIKRRDKNSG